MNKKIYLECYSGISGDMTVAALLDLGANENKLLKTLEQLNISDEFDIKISKVNKCGIMANDFDVILKEHHHIHRNLDDVYVSTLYEGEGFVNCAHGLLPVPVPAVLNIVNKYNISLKITDHEGELITPTGAAIVAAIKNNDKLPVEFRIINTGLGAGKKYPDKPSILRAMIIEEEL